MHKKIAVLAGDGIGPEVMEKTLSVLDEVSEKFNHHFDVMPALIGGAAYDEYQDHCPDETLKVCEKADAILFGSVGGPVDQQHVPKWRDCETNSILKLRKHFEFNINLRPIIVSALQADSSPLKNDRIGGGIDILFFRELCGDIYFGEHQLTENEAKDVANYTKEQIASIAHQAFKAASKRKGQIVSVDKANVLATSKLWRNVVTEISKLYPEVKLTHMLVDNAAMQLVINPQQFDVVLTSNLFGDILTDLASALPGSVGFIPSASINKNGFGLYEPAGGSAPDIAGKGIANPTGQILSAAMLLRHSFGFKKEADYIQNLVL
jgi:3-isopropylmalate dehydrogenase